MNVLNELDTSKWFIGHILLCEFYHNKRKQLVTPKVRQVTSAPGPPSRPGPVACVMHLLFLQRTWIWMEMQVVASLLPYGAHHLLFPPGSTSMVPSGKPALPLASPQGSPRLQVQVLHSAAALGGRMQHFGV